MQLMNGTQFLNATPLFIPSVCLTAVSGPFPVIVIVPSQRTYQSL